MKRQSLSHNARQGFTRRSYFLLIGFMAIGAFISWRLFGLSVVDHKEISILAAEQKAYLGSLRSNRGEIYAVDKSMTRFPLAINKSWPVIFVNPQRVPSGEEWFIAQRLSKILDVDSSDIFKQLTMKNLVYRPLVKKADEELLEKIKQENIEGIEVTFEKGRFYPQKELASRTVGFLGYSADYQVGRYGLEQAYEEKLAQGDTIITTIDQNIQQKAEQLLDEALKEYKASSGLILVVDPKSGAVKALSAKPSFDPNNYSQVDDYSIYINPAVSSVFEPGSVFKPITMSIALDQARVSPETTFEDKGYIKIGRDVIRNTNSKAWGVQSMVDVLRRSINTGAIFVQRQVPKDIFHDYIKKFGFGSPTGIDLPAEASGNIDNLKDERDIDYAVASFGQGISVTPIQLVMAGSVLANGGELLKPYVVEYIERKGDVIYKAKPRVIRRVIRPETASRISSMMTQVVSNGTGRYAQVKGYSVAGKTGTAQIASQDSRGYTEETIHSFLGYAPAFNPSFIALVKLDKPQNARYSELSAAKVFHELAVYILQYYNIQPDRL